MTYRVNKNADKIEVKISEGLVDGLYWGIRNELEILKYEVNKKGLFVHKNNRKHRVLIDEVVNRVNKVPNM